MKILILVMSAQKMPWGPMIGTAVQTWDSVKNENTSTIYYIGRYAGLEFPLGRSDLIESPFDEELKNLGHRTLHAYEHALTIPDWQFIARVNSSCYVHKRLLVEYCDRLPTTGVLCGITADSNIGFQYLWGGGQFILSRDVVESIVRNKYDWDHSAMEDVAVSKLAIELGISFTAGRACSINKQDNYLCIGYGFGEIGTFRFDAFSEFASRNLQHFIRCKHDPDRTVDAVWMRELKKYLPK